MKQTAVDFIVTKFNHLTWLRRRGEISEVTENERQAKLFSEAKAMEKKQIIDAWVDGDNSDCLSEQDSSDFAERYYNETFNTNNK